MPWTPNWLSFPPLLIASNTNLLAHDGFEFDKAARLNFSNVVNNTIYKSNYHIQLVNRSFFETFSVYIGKLVKFGVSTCNRRFEVQVRGASSSLYVGRAFTAWYTLMLRGLIIINGTVEL